MQEPTAALAEALDEAQAASPDAPVILCFAGEGAQLHALPEELLARCSVVIHALAAMPASLGADAPQVYALRDGAGGMLQGTEGGGWTLRKVKHRGAADPAVQTALSETTSLKDLAVQPPPGPEAGGVAVPARVRNRAMEASLMGLEKLPSWRDRAAPEGYEWLVLELDFENKLARDLRRELDYADAIHIASQTRQLLLRVDGARLLRPVDAAPVPVDQRLFLSEPGDFLTQRLGYLLPVGENAKLELCIYHDEFASMVLPIRDGEAVELSGEAVATAENDVLSAALRAAPRSKGEGEAAILWEADVFGQSRIRLETDARALRKEASPKDRGLLGKPFEYLLAREMVALVDTEGRHAWALESPDVDAEPVFDSEAPSAARWTFRLPPGAEPKYIWLAFPALNFTHEAVQRDPSPLELAFGGQVEQERPAPLHSFGGDPVAMDLAWAKFDAGRLSVGVDLSNVGSVPGMLEPLKRLKVDGTIAPSGASFGLPDSGRLFLVPGQHRFRVELGFDLPADRTSWELSFGGVDAVHSVMLGLEGQAVVVGARGIAAAPAPESAPEPTPGAQAELDPEPAPLAADVVDELLPPEPKGLAGEGLTGQEVNAAIDRGADFLWEELKGRSKKEDLSDIGSFDEEEALALLALSHAGLQHRNNEFARTLPLAVQNLEVYLRRAYANCVVCMLLDHLDDPAHRPLLRRAVKTLIEEQNVDGTWNYNCTVPRPPATPEDYVSVFSPQSTELERELPYGESTGGDNSVLQFVMMAFRSAERQGLKVPRDVWERSRRTMLERVGGDGGWSYVEASRSYGSMTCAGIGTLAIADWALGITADDAEGAASSAAIRGGMAWMAEHYKASSNPKTDRHNYYYMYSTERVGRLLDVEFYGQNEWYPRGARALVDHQNVDGSWKEGREIVQPTSFALLFLTRATESLVEEKVAATTGTLDVVSKPLEERAVLFILDVSGSMRSKLGEQTKLDWARNAVVKLSEGLDESVFMGLRVYGHRLRANAKGADRDTELLLPLDPLSSSRRAALGEALAGLSPRGKTPMAFSLEESLRDIDRQKQGTVVLLTDGGEDARSKKDPVAISERFAKLRRWDLAVVGFDIGKPKWQAQLKAMAEAAEGVYLATDAGEELLSTLRTALVPLPERIELVPDDGSPARWITLPSKLELPAGLYHLRFDVGGEAFDVPVTVKNGGASRVVLDPSRFQKR